MRSDAKYPTGISVTAAQDLIVATCAARHRAVENIALAESLGRVLAETVHAPFDVPGFANSAMDGYALRATDLPPEGERIFKLAGVMLAGGSTEAVLREGECVRITTGAPLPRGADCIVIKESACETAAGIVLPAGGVAGDHVRPAGEDYRAGDLAIRSGEPLGAAQLGVLASFGLTSVSVVRRPRVALFSTGDELVATGEALGYGQIHDSNRPVLAALIAQAGGEVVLTRHLRDDVDALRAALVEAAASCDVIISSGGVSAGEADLLPGLVVELGSVHFWKVRVKPGMPFLAGQIGAALVFSLPGNPVSGIATFLALVRPGIDALLGRAPRTAPLLHARLAHGINKRHKRTELMRATLSCAADGVLEVAAYSRQGSAVLRGVAESNALIVVPEETLELAQGAIVAIYPLEGWP